MTLYLFKSLGLFIATAIAEIVGCYLPYLWLKKDGSIWLLLPAALSLVIFVWLLSLHPTAAARTYAAYGGVYIGVAILWMWFVESITPTAWDITGVLVSMTGMAIIILGAQQS